MKKALMLSAFIGVFAMPVMATETAELHKNWGYTGSERAMKWGDLDKDYHLCKSGDTQSPINIEQYAQDDMPPLEISYEMTSLDVANNGHTVQVNYAPGSTLSVDGKSYELQHYHFHTPSEHYVDGAPYPMEVHFEHEAEDGELAIISVMMKVGKHNPVIQGIWQNIPEKGHSKELESVQYSAKDLLPESKEYYKYTGSLTTPPCTEGVQWHVMKDPIEISHEQLVTFQDLYPVNSRPVQPLNDRLVRGN